MKRGQVYYADLRPVVGSEQGGIRPCLIIQNDVGNTYSPTVIVATMTTQKKNDLPIHVAVSTEDCVDINTTILLEQLRTIDKSRLSSFVGRLSDSTMRKVDEALYISLALNKEERKEETELNELQIFQNDEFGQVRTVDIDGKTYFVATDVAKALGYSNPRDAILRHCKGVVKHDGVCQTTNQHGVTTEQKVLYSVIPEGDIYRLIIKSQLPSADKFERWIFDEVIPTIRKTGAYEIPKDTDGKIALLAQGHTELSQKVENAVERIVNLENNMTIDYGQQRVLEDAVNKTVIDILGGKGSDAYKEVGRKVFAECNRDLKHHFDVNARNNVPKKRFDEAVEYARNWKPCTNTMMMISDCNAQMVV